MKIYNVTYEFKGVEVHNIFLEDDLELPDNWEEMSLKAQDEWLYENQTYANKVYSDTEWGQAVAIMPVATLERKAGLHSV